MCKETQEKWKEMCNFTESYDVKNKFLCSKHFRAEEFYKPHSKSKGVYLRKSAIPTIRVINEIAEHALSQPGLNLPCTKSADTPSNTEDINLPCTSFEGEKLFKLKVALNSTFLFPFFLDARPSTNEVANLPSTSSEGEKQIIKSEIV